eukprot:scaffold5308_cov70-Phaeocystis_antarctica.AAC.5
MASARIFSRFFQRALLRRQLSHRHEDGKGHKRRAQVRRVLLDARKRAWCSRFDDAPGRLMLVADAGRIKVVPVAREGDEKVAIPRVTSKLRYFGWSERRAASTAYGSSPVRLSRLGTPAEQR